MAEVQDGGLLVGVVNLFHNNMAHAADKMAWRISRGQIKRYSLYYES